VQPRYCQHVGDACIAEVRHHFFIQVILFSDEESLGQAAVLPEQAIQPCCNTPAYAVPKAWLPPVELEVNPAAKAD
jgi:hypothetical protein